MGKHVGHIETWIEARANVRRGKGMAPKYARAGRHAMPPSLSSFTFKLMRKRSQPFYGWTRASIEHAYRIGALA